MKLTIGENIRSLRREKGVTQEQFAGVFGVTYQSVSRWENDLCYPDMELLPDIAAYFGITVDRLLGADKDAEKREVDAYLARFADALSRGAIEDCIAIARAGVAAYPNNYALLNKLMYALFMAGDEDGSIPNWRENMEAHDAEITALGERIMASCPDADIRAEATARLAFNHCEMGRRDIGRKIYETLPSMDNCREVSIWWALDGNERLENARVLIQKGYDILSSGVAALAARPALTDAEKAAVLEKGAQLEDWMHDGQADHSDWGTARGLYEQARVYARLGEDAKVYAALQEAVACARAFDQRPDEEVVETLLLGKTILRRTDFETSDARPLTEIVRDKWLAVADFDRLRETAPFQAILAGLTE